MMATLARPVLLLLSLYCALASAQGLKDPTRPPAGLAPGVSGHGAFAPDPASGPQLQSVMLSPSRRSAIISGRLVSRGEHYGDAVLAEVAEDHVVLRRGTSTQILRLYPGAAKRPVERPGTK